MSLTEKPTNALELFFSYTQKDEKLFKELEIHISVLQQQGFIVGWHGYNVNAGTDWRNEVLAHLNTAQIILLLISPDFLASEYWQSVEVKRAIERHEAGEARVIPIILRACQWEATFIQKLQVLPTSRKPVREWSSHDRAFLQVVQGIRKVVEELREATSPTQPPGYMNQSGPAQDDTMPKAQERQDALRLFQQERDRQEQRTLFIQHPIKIDKDIIISYDLDNQMREFRARLNFGGAYAFVLGGQYNVLRDYIIERMCRELRSKMGRAHRKIDISLLREDVTGDRRYIIKQKVIARNHCYTIVDPFRENPTMDVVLTIWNHFFPPEIVREAAAFFWEDVATSIVPFLMNTGQCLVVVLANVGEKASIHQLDHFTLLPAPESFEIAHLTQWVQGWLRGRGVKPVDIEACLNRLRDNHGHFIPTYQEIENIISDLQGRYNDS